MILFHPYIDTDISFFDENKTDKVNIGLDYIQSQFIYTYLLHVFNYLYVFFKANKKLNWIDEEYIATVINNDVSWAWCYSC